MSNSVKYQKMSEYNSRIFDGGSRFGFIPIPKPSEMAAKTVLC